MHHDCVACLGYTTVGVGAEYTLHAMTATSMAAHKLWTASGWPAPCTATGCSSCVIAGDMCLRDNPKGIQQQDPAHAHAAVD